MSHTLHAVEQLVLRDFKIRYRNMSLGILWSLLNPLVLVGVYTFVFTRIFKNDTIKHFPLHLLIGIVCFNYFSLAWISATYSITSNSGLIKRVNVPRLVIPLSAVLGNAIHFVLQMILVLAFTFWIGIPVGLPWLWLPLLILLLILSISGLSLLTSAMDVYFRDTRYIVESAALVLFWLTPIFYSEKMVPPEFKMAFLLNPVTDVVIAMRQVIIERRSPDPGPMLYALATTTALLLLGVTVFQELKKKFADHL